MSALRGERATFDEAVSTLYGTGKGRESVMYGPLRDLFQLLGYARRHIHIDMVGRRGRADITVQAPGGNARGEVVWIVVEAKDERGAAADPVRRRALYQEKAKYITSDTAYILMVDPTAIVIRNTAMGAQSEGDIVLPLNGLTLETFLDKSAPIRAEVAGVPEVLKRFREGDESIIACDRLTAAADADADAELAAQIARNVFFDSLRETTQLLQQAVLRALINLRPQRTEIEERVRAFEAEFGPSRFQAYPVSIESTASMGLEQSHLHRRASTTLRKHLNEQPALSRLTIQGLPRFAERTALDLGTNLSKVEKFFATETANLILARILLIRFLEDYGFYDETTTDGPKKRRYLCNGGVAAFQGMLTYFGQGYTRLLEEAYRVGARFYSAAFDETEMDWIFALSDAELSRTVEWAMFRVARFDFTTVRGDILTGIYDHFLDRKQRKDQGEYYTPPSIARYILSRLNLLSTDDVLDPSCGSGTFLIEHYQEAVGKHADSGFASLDEAKAVIERLAGNDINPFSAILTQIQLLWHLLVFGKELITQGVPELHISERVNSLAPNPVDPGQIKFSEVDRSGYRGVVGNPPYIRNERAQAIEEAAKIYFTGSRTVDGKVFKGIPVKRNAYGLFIYKALDHWCQQPGTDAPPGKLGFIIPLNFCGSGDTAALRKLFEPGGRWAILEIVDLETIWRDVFDADVLPMILIAEARPATESDRVKIRLADQSCVVREAGAKRATFRFDHLPEHEVDYAGLFAPDGRILTRLTEERVQLLRKLWTHDRLRSAALPYWTKMSGGKQHVRADEPTGYGSTGWHREYLIKYGIEMKGDPVILPEGGLPVWKGENVTTSVFTGDYLYTHLDVTQAHSATVWAYAHILPPKMYAIPIIEQVPVAAEFDPSQVAVVNSVAVFGPRFDLADVPFDMVLLSRIYSWSYATSGRHSFNNKLRSHLYPPVVADLPWSEAIAGHGPALQSIKTDLLNVCQARFQTAAHLGAAAEKLGLISLTALGRATTGAKITKNDIFEADPNFILSVGELVVEGDEVRLPLSETGHAALFNLEEIAILARAGLRLKEGDELDWNKVLRTPVPADHAMQEQLQQLTDNHNPDHLDDQIELTIDRIDALVGAAMGLSEEEIAFIRKDMMTDPFLSQITPRYPFFRPQQRGRRAALSRSDRYARGHAEEELARPGSPT